MRSGHPPATVPSAMPPMIHVIARNSDGSSGSFSITVALMIPPPELISGPGRREKFLEQARAAQMLNHPNIATLFDVVDEGGHAGPTFCFRGFDNATYYILDPNDRGRYADYSGCGNTLNANNPIVVNAAYR